MFLLLVATFILASLLFYNCYWKRKHLPPGPVPLFIFGNLPQLIGQKTVEEKQLEWFREYGDLFTMWQGNNAMVMVSDYQLCVDLFVKDGESYIDRGFERDFMAETRGTGGVILTEGDKWREQRRFALHVLRDYGLNKNLMQERILEEVLTLHERIDKQSKLRSDIAVNELIDMSVGSIINCFLLGYRYTDDKLSEFRDLRHRARSFMEVSGDPIVTTIRSSGYTTILKRLPFFRAKFDKVQSTSHYLLAFFRERVAEYKAKKEDYDSETDFVSAFLKEKRRRDLLGESHYFTDSQLVSMLFDLWIAGQETTSNTLGWAVVYLIHHPKTLAKAHAELDSVVNSDRMVTLSDKPKLPYMCAIVNEAQRMANLLPVNAIRKTIRDVRVRNYDIPKGTWMVPHICIILSNPKIFEDPNTFKPERFIDVDGKFKASPEVIPFSLGKRVCLGEGLARMELFLFLSNLVNQYKILPGETMPSLVRRDGVSVRADNFTCRLERRFK